jgi:hypothetical protein
MKTKLVKETAFFGSQQMVAKQRSDYDIQPIEDYKWGYILSHDNIVGDSFKLKSGLEAKKSVYKNKEIWTVFMPYSMLEENEMSYEGIEYEVEVCLCCDKEVLLQEPLE